MPLYEYKCQACGKKFEVIQKFSNEPLTTHPECGGPAEKLVSAPAFHLKGTGWYATDYAKSNSSGTPKNEDSSSKAAESSAGTSESKPAATETKAESKKESAPAPATPST